MSDGDAAASSRSHRCKAAATVGHEKAVPDCSDKADDEAKTVASADAPKTTGLRVTAHILRCVGT